MRTPHWQWSVRLLALAAAGAALLGLGRADWTAGLLPGISPLAAFSRLLADGDAALASAALWLLPAGAVILLAVWRGRFFCNWLCPLGTLLALVSRLSLRRHPLKFRPNGWIFWALVFAALAGGPLLLWLDPLSIFNRLSLPLRQLAPGAAWIAIGFMLLLGIMNLVQPLVWCTHFCPLGYFLQRSREVRRKSPAGSADPQNAAGAPGAPRGLAPGRREFLGGMLLGLPLGLLTRRLRRAIGSEPPILPPGATEPGDFAARCSRCYACVAVCPTRVIRVAPPRADRSPLQLLQPELDPEKGHCEQHCTRCSEVCPTGAIRRLTKEKKDQRQVGLAVVIRSACLAWTDDTDCLACHEFCPYQAIDIVQNDAGIGCPVILPDLCRGCGSCQKECPATRAGKAILVRGVSAQRQLPESVPAATTPAASTGRVQPAPAKKLDNLPGSFRW